MIGLITAELVKIRTTKTFFGLTMGAILFASLAVIATILTGGGGGQFLTPRGFASLGNVAYIFSGVLGVLVITGEARHSTADHTFLVTPNRTKVVLAKTAAALAAGAVMGFIVEVAIFAIGLPLLASRGVSYSFEAGILVAIFWQLFAIGVMAVFGMAVGALVRNQIAGIVLVAGWLFLGENLVLNLLLPDLSRYGVVAAFQSLAGGGAFRLWAGFLLLAYLLVLGGLGTALLERRDLT